MTAVTHATFTLDPAYPIGSVDPRILGTFVEHMGRCVYGGMYEPDHPSADEDGFRQDVAALVRELGPTVVRYPGGNFVSGYRWEDGVGPRDQRPRRLDPAWKAIESNQVGIDEFLPYSRRVGMEPIMGMNLGTRGVQEAVDLLEYCNFPGGTALSDLRRANGHPEPHAVKVWCLGNELDGPWQQGHKTAEEYGRLAAETARAMRMVDKSIELVACGSSNSTMPTFAAWEATVLEHCYDLVDYVSLHNYYDPVPDDLPTFLASSVDLDRAIEAIISTADHIGAKVRSHRKLKLSVDEWNVWYQTDFPGQDGYSYSDPDPAVIEDVYDVADAVVVGSLLITLLRHADRVGIACQAQLVNVIAPIMTRTGGPAWRQTIFHPFAQTARWAKGEVLAVPVAVPAYDTDKHGETPLVEATATYDEETGALAVFVANRAVDGPTQLSVDLHAFASTQLVEAWVLAEDDVHARNTEEHPDRVRPRPLHEVHLDGSLEAVLPPVSWTVLRLRVGRRSGERSAVTPVPASDSPTPVEADPSR